jgi:hypothetical protein
MGKELFDWLQSISRTAEKGDSDYFKAIVQELL